MKVTIKQPNEEETNKLFTPEVKTTLKAIQLLSTKPNFSWASVQSYKVVDMNLIENNIIENSVNSAGALLKATSSSR